MEPADRFWAKVDKNGPKMRRLKTRCWLWLGAKDKYGYGNVKWGGAVLKAHKVAWLLHAGSVPEGQYFRRRCATSACVRPVHLFLVQGAATESGAAVQLRGKARTDYRREKGLCLLCWRLATCGALCIDCWFGRVVSTATGTRADLPALRALFDAQGGLCAYTGKVLVPGTNASLDHKIPRSRGGPDTVENLQWVDYRINLMKNALLHDEFLVACRQVLAYASRSTMGVHK